jgi:hypothetical protein
VPHNIGLPVKKKRITLVCLLSWMETTCIGSQAQMFSTTI